jgi:V8-like Glu-specific endopeptidase
MSDPANVVLRGTTLGQQQNLCAGQRFTDDPAVSICSATLIDDDLVLTAGHCMPNATFCRTTAFVFNYYRTSANALHAITMDDVFDCTSIVVRDQAMTSGGTIDYAVVRLARSATPRFTPASVYMGNDLVTTGQTLTCIGFPNGIPLKIDSGGSVRDPRAATRDYFLATTDTFAGSSGSGVFDRTTLELRGVLLDGDTDYVLNGACNVVHQCAETGCSGESVGYVRHALDALCTTAPTVRLCGDAGVRDAGADAVVPDAALVDAIANDVNGGDASVRTDGGLERDDTPTPSGCACRAHASHGRAWLGVLSVAFAMFTFAARRRRERRPPAAP